MIIHSLAIVASQFSSARLLLGSLLAQSTAATSAAGGTGPSPSIQWAIVGFAIILGALLTLSPSRRTYEVKKG